jgi:prophage regulatory protein
MLKTSSGDILGDGTPRLRKFLRLKQVREVTGLPTTTIYEQMGRGEFPAAFKIGARAVAWLEDDIAAWQAARIAERDGEA